MHAYNIYQDTREIHHLFLMFLLLLVISMTISETSQRTTINYIKSRCVQDKAKKSKLKAHITCLGGDKMKHVTFWCICLYCQGNFL